MEPDLEAELRDEIDRLTKENEQLKRDNRAYLRLNGRKNPIDSMVEIDKLPDVFGHYEQ